APPSAGLARPVSQMISFLQDNPGSAAWLADTLPSDTAAVLVSSAWYQKQLASFAEITSREILSPPPGESQGTAEDPPASRIRVGGLLFTGLSGGSLVQGEPFPHCMDIEPFMICATEVPAPAYADFLDANPQWRLERREELERQGLVTPEYLADFGNLGRGRAASGINAVSWHAARAYCEWLGTKLPDSFRGWEIRLPTEAEWEYAAKSFKNWGGPGIYAQDGNVWEWCSDPYSPLPFIDAPAEAFAAVASPERPVRGGSWLNASASTSLETRASLPPASCSPFVSFRPVIAIKP
ncbi:MAG: SUMF1/EgtB/PvdO family nonheme iron enzyme, partial [Treponema sp.]|nr:SUMF1/EgtB/PvdO family nonheme iron enzyme [Treponema sp.]